jgi:hypothetical protein
MLSGRVQHGRSARLWSSDECASITAARPPIAAPASTSTPTALPCAILCHAAGFWAVLRSGIAARKSPNDALLNFSFFKRHPSGHLRTSEPPNNAFLSRRPRIYVQARPASAAASADGRACSFNPTVPLSSTPGSPAPQPGTFVDVGANGGWETRLALAAGMNVLAVECLPEAYQELRVIFHGMPAARLRLCCTRAHPIARGSQPSTGRPTPRQWFSTMFRAGLRRSRRGRSAPRRARCTRSCSTPSFCRRERQIRPHSARTCAWLRSTRRSHLATNPLTRKPNTSLPTSPPPYVSSIALLPIPCGRGTSCSCYPGCVALSAHVATSHLLREHMNQMEIASLAAVEAWVEAMLSTAPLSYICTRGLQDTLCVHAERRQKRIVGTKHRARPEGHFWTKVVTSI